MRMQKLIPGSLPILKTETPCKRKVGEFFGNFGVK